jgi:hypothetical protein
LVSILHESIEQSDLSVSRLIRRSSAKLQPVSSSSTHDSTALFIGTGPLRFGATQGITIDSSHATACALLRTLDKMWVIESRRRPPCCDGGVMHQVSELDTLGYDRTESKCKFK